ncbi:ribosome silencing factor [Candidatus Hydrogenedentota bacterium]
MPKPTKGRTGTSRKSIAKLPKPENPYELAREIVKAASQRKAIDPVVLDLQGLSIMADYFVIFGSESSVGVGAIAKTITSELARRRVKALRSAGTGESGWVLIDFGDVIVHIFLEETRHFYDLESLWGDAPLVSFDEEDGGASGE